MPEDKKVIGKIISAEFHKKAGKWILELSLRLESCSGHSNDYLKFDMYLQRLPSFIRQTGAQRESDLGKTVCWLTLTEPEVGTPVKCLDIKPVFDEHGTIGLGCFLKSSNKEKLLEDVLDAVTTSRNFHLLKDLED